MAKSTHVHKLKRLKYKSGNTIFFCSLPDCTFKTNIALALGKRTICWRCGEPFIMSEYSLRLAKPHCENCHRPKESIIETSNSSVVLEPTILPEVKTLSLAERIRRSIHDNSMSQNGEEDI